MWDKSFRGWQLKDSGKKQSISYNSGPFLRFTAVLLLIGMAGPAQGREKDVLEYGAGLIVNIPLPEPEVAQVVEDVAANTMIRGTKE